MLKEEHSFLDLIPIYSQYNFLIPLVLFTHTPHQISIYLLPGLWLGLLGISLSLSLEAGVKRNMEEDAHGY